MKIAFEGQTVTVDTKLCTAHVSKGPHTFVLRTGSAHGGEQQELKTGHNQTIPLLGNNWADIAVLGKDGEQKKSFLIYGPA